MPEPIHLPDGGGYWEWPDGTPILWWEDTEMTYTLFDLTYMVARELGIVRESTATGGTVGTLIDTNYLTQADDYWNNGTVWILRDAGGAGAAPEGEYAIASDFAASSDTLTLQANLTVAPASGDRYAVCRAVGDGAWLQVIISAINSALANLDKVPYVDVTSVTIAADKTEYSLPVASKNDLRQVFIQTHIGDADDNQWAEIFNWEVSQADPGTAPTLILPVQYTEGYAVKLVYMAPHPDLYVYTAALSEFVPVERITYPAVRDCFIYMRNQTGWRNWDDDIQNWTGRAEQVKTQRRIRNVPIKPGRIGGIGFGEKYYPGDRKPR